MKTKIPPRSTNHSASSPQKTKRRLEDIPAIKKQPGLLQSGAEVARIALRPLPHHLPQDLSTGGFRDLAFPNKRDPAGEMLVLGQPLRDPGMDVFCVGGRLSVRFERDVSAGELLAVAA